MKNVFFITLATVFLCAGFYARYYTAGEGKYFEIYDGDTGVKIAQKLNEEGFIKHPKFFRALMKISFTSRKIKPGRYALNKNISEEEALWRLLKSDGKVYIKLSVPEGWRAEQIADELSAQGICAASDFMAMVRDENLEGYLFPSTYFFERHTSARTVVNVMTTEFEKQMRPILDAPHPKHLSEREVLVIASIVEREAANPAERPLVAAVYFNRLKMGMPLEADPTVQYALGYSAREKDWWKKKIYYKNLKIDSPYNTYKYRAIPPGPICNMGVESVKAVYNPADIDAIFFVADGKGNHIFNRDFKAHIRAKNILSKSGR